MLYPSELQARGSLFDGSEEADCNFLLILSLIGGWR
jgi:hypothetical protein